MNIVIDIIISLLFISIVLKEVKYIKRLAIPTRKTYGEIVIVLFSVVILIGIIYFYGSTWIHYVLGILGILAFVSGWIKQGINSKGFTSIYRYKKVILWNEIEKVMIISSKDIKVKVSGGFMQQTFHFKKSDYDKVMSILEENLSKQAKIQTLSK